MGPSPTAGYRQAEGRALIGLIARLVVVLAVAGLAVVLTTERGSRPLIAKAFELDAEFNVPTLFQVGLFLFCALLLFDNGRRSRRLGNRAVFGWFAFGAVFVLLAIDELLSFHNHLAVLVPTDWADVPGLRYRWVVPGAAFAAAVAVLSVAFLLSLPRPIAMRFVAAGAVFLTGAIGMEMLAAYAHSINADMLTYELCSVVEETLEMAGLALFASALLTQRALLAQHAALQNQTVT